MNTLMLGVTCVGLGSFGASAQGGADAYRIIELPPIVGFTTSSALAVNNSGMVAGFSYNGSTWVETVWSPDGSGADLGFFGASSGARALDINDNGDVLLGAVGASSQVIGWAVRFADGTETFIQAQGIYSDAKVYAMNSFGEVCGSVFDASQDEQFAAIWRPTPGGFVQEVLPTNPFVNEGHATAINDAGLVATTERSASGDSALIDRRSGVGSEGFSGEQIAEYVDLNNAGQGVVRHDLDVIVIATAVPGLGDVYPLNCDGTGMGGVYCLKEASVIPSAINERNVVVGRSPTVQYDSQGYPNGHNGIFEAFVWSQEEGTRRCLDLVVEGDTSGWLLTEAYDINDSGWIVGEGLKDGVAMGYLLIPREPCAGDVNRDGAVTPTDFSAWVGAYQSGCD